MFSPIFLYAFDEVDSVVVSAVVSGSVHSSTGKVMINEVSMDSTPDWVEIYNGSTNTVDLQGWTLDDVDAATPVEISVPVVMPAGVHLAQTGW